MVSLGRGLAAVALGLGAVLGTAAPASADTVYLVETQATGVHVTLTQQPASSMITASLVDDATAYAASAFDGSGGSEAQAASVFPGSLVTQGPALMCSQLLTCPVSPPSYPLLADASYPTHPRDEARTNQKAVGSGPFVVAPSSAVATASSSANEGRTTAGSARLLSGTPVAVTVGASSATSRVTSAGNGLTVHVESLVSDVEVGGLVHIGGVHATDDVVMHAGKAPTDTPHITVSGVTVAGVAATIDEKGLHVAGHDGPRLTQQVAKKGISLRTIGVDRRDSRSVARSSAMGLVIDFSVPVSGTPYVPNPLPSPFSQVPGVDANGTYVGHVGLGGIGVAAAATAGLGFGLGGFAPLSTPMSTPGTAGGTTAAVGSAAGAPAEVAPPAQQPVVAPPRGLLHTFLDGFTTDLANLYAVLALGMAALFVGWRGMIALRRHRPVAWRRG